MAKRPPSGSERINTSSAEVLDQAILALKMQRPNEAERLASGILKSQRGNVLAAHILGRALLMQNRVEEAVDHLQIAARRSHDPSIETLLASALGSVGRDDEAFDQLRRTTARQPPFPPAFLELGSRLAKIGRFEDGISLLENGLVLMPDAQDLRMRLGYLYLECNDRAKARGLFLHVRSAAPERHDAHVAVAKVMALDGEYEAAAGLYRIALGLRPDDAVSRIDLGKCLLEINQRDAGEAMLRAAARGAPHLAGMAITALASSAHGRFFLRPSAAAQFLRTGQS